MSKLEEREAKRKSAVASIVGDIPTSQGRRELPTGGRELKKRISLSVRPSLYRDVQKIAYIQRRSVSEVIEKMMELYRERHSSLLEEYDKLKK